MHNSEPVTPPNPLSPSSVAAGPLPKSDSVHSLVSILNCPSPATASFEQPSVVRGVDDKGETQIVKLHDDVDYISLSGRGLKTVSLSALQAAPVADNLREISLAANTLEMVDLTPLSTCHGLSVLCLNSNRLASIDLAPLASCVKLERLWLHDNKLEKVDLGPLRACKSLRSLYLEDNSLHEYPLNLEALSSSMKLRSLRLGGNRLGGTLDLTPLLQCPALSVFNIDSSIALISDGESSQARVSPALRRIVLDIKFTGKVVGERTLKRRTTPPISPKAGFSPTRLRRRVLAESSITSDLAPGSLSLTPGERTGNAIPSPIVKVLLVGFRRLARYAAEDSFTKCGKIMIRAAHQDVASRDPGLLLDSHLVILYAPPEKTLRQITVVVGRIPTVVIGTERYRSTADNRMLELLDRFNFYADPLDPEDTRVVYNMGKAFASNTNQLNSHGSLNHTGDESLDSSPLSEEEGNEMLRKSYSVPSIETLECPGIAIEGIDDDEGHVRDTAFDAPGYEISRTHSADDILDDLLNDHISHLPAKTWSEVTRRLRDRRGMKVGRARIRSQEISMHGKNRLRAERAAIEVAFSDLGGCATADSCSGIARSCGLPKCAGPLLFQAAFGSSFEIESTTPEAGVPNLPLERKNRRISGDAFLAYWDSRLKECEGEERLSNLLIDRYASLVPLPGKLTGHSEYGAPLPNGASRLVPRNFSEFDLNAYSSRLIGSHRNKLTRRRSGGMSTDISCPCDSGIELLISSFMEARSSRFGSFALVKMSEAIAIGSSLVMYGLRGVSKNPVGGHARPVCPKEVREGKLNAALVAAEAGIFEGVASGLSMGQIRSVKGSFATEACPTAVSRSGGLALDYSLTVAEVQKFCTTRKTLLPSAVQATVSTHCRNKKEMTLAEFAIFLSVLNNLSSNGAVDYFFSVVDVDHDEYWTIPDLREFHMEKEKLWLKDGMAVSDLVDIWVNLTDMVRPKKPGRGISRREFLNLGTKERKLVMQSLLFVDDDCSVLNIRRTMELNEEQ